MTKVVDVHNHWFPPEWIAYLENRKGSPRMERKGGQMLFYAQGQRCSRISKPGHYDLATRVSDLDRCGIDTQLLSLTIPGVEELPLDEGVAWARKINDHFADACRSYPGRFYAYAHLPYQDVGEALKELERAFKELGVKGITIYSNINFKPLCSEEFEPIYAKAAEYHLPIFVHPAVPFCNEDMKKHHLNPGLYGFTTETSAAIMSLIWTGMMEKYPGLTIIHSHLGGVVPYLARRMEDSWRAHNEEFGLALKKSPTEYYRTQVYPDSMSGYLPAMRCCLDFVGPRHICLGTDYAHGIGNWDQAIAVIKELGLSEEETNGILGGNAARICGLD